MTSRWHLVTPESPPQIGGVADFTRVIATALAAGGHDVHVWSPTPADEIAGVSVHSLHDGYAARRLGALDRALDAFEGPRRLFVQWVPHGYGYNSLNIPFCLWVWRRARLGDVVDLMVHEPFLPFAPGRLRQNGGAIVHRLMLMVMLRAATRVWVSTPSFLPMVRPFGPRKAVPYTWLPIPSPIPRGDTAADVRDRRRALAGAHPTIGYFGTASPLVTGVLEEVIAGIAKRRPDVKFVLLGRGTEGLARTLESKTPGLAQAIVARGMRSTDDLSALIQCCDLFVQPYPDGVSARRTTLMALLDHGRAIVASRGIRTEEGWQEAVHLTAHGDATAMVEAALTLLDAPARRAELSHAASRLYADRFSVGRALDVLMGTPDA